MSNKSKDPFAGWGWLGAILGGLYGYALNENGGEAFAYAFLGYGTGWLVGFVVNTFLAWIVLTFILLVALSLLQNRIGIFKGQTFIKPAKTERLTIQETYKESMAGFRFGSHEIESVEVHFDRTLCTKIKNTKTTSL